jgi:hypothetical protein
MRLSRNYDPAMAEEHAARIVDSGSALRRSWLGLTAGVRLLLNPNDTQQAFLLSTAVDRPRLARLHAELSKLPAGRALLAERPAIDSKSVDYAYLRSLPATTLGGAYALALQRQRLDPDVFQPPPLLRRSSLTWCSGFARRMISGTWSPGFPPTSRAKSRCKRSPTGSCATALRV